jgi:hypothetical protein
MSQIIRRLAVWGTIQARCQLHFISESTRSRIKLEGRGGSQKGKGRPFPKGVSGNPGGRPKVLGDVQELARQKSPEAINTLSNIMNDEKAPSAARVAAANALLDRGYGKPTQPIFTDSVEGRSKYDQR